MRTDGEFRWFYGPSEDAEAFYHADDRDDAIKKGMETYGSEQEEFFIGEADTSLVVCNFDAYAAAERIMEEIIENNGDIMSEDGFDDDVPPGLDRAIEEAVEQWLEINPIKGWMIGQLRTWEEIKTGYKEEV